MGNCFSDPSHKGSKGQGQVLGSGPASTAPGRTTGETTSQRPQRAAEPPRTLGAGPGGAEFRVGLAGGDGGDPRERALRAAEERAKAAQGKGVNATNPKAGQLSAKLAAEKRKPSSPGVNEDRMMDRGQWN
ncbi:hypothetical protein IAU60_006430 [Kwoniella sp. DSM 27419]